MLTEVEKELAVLLRYDPPYEWRGGNKALIESRAPEVIAEGPSETGKTFAACYKMHYNCREYPGSQHTLVRKVAATIPPTVLVTMRRVIGEFPVTPYGGWNGPETIIYPNGSKIWIAGMDKPGKALSGERDTIQVCQAEELSIDDWEILTTRVTGRGAVMPYTQLFGDCNPGPAKWIKDRAKAGSLQLVPTRHEDNPSLFTSDGIITEQGRRSMARLDALTGTRYKRLRLGLWVSAEGAIYDEFDPSIHMIDIDKCPPFIRRFRVVDFGFTNPFVCQWWGMDADGRLYRYREIYQTQKLVEDITPEIIRLSTGENVEYTVADHDAEDRATMEKHGIKTKAAKKDVSPGIQAVKARLKVQGDGKPRIYFVRNALVKVDERLREAHKPICTEDEIIDYAWVKTQDGKPDKEQPLKVNDHGCLISGTMIETLYGLRPIESICTGDYVLTRQGYKMVLSCGMTQKEAEIIRVEFSDGTTLTGTKDHPVYVRGKGYISLDTLRYGDTIVLASEQKELAQWKKTNQRLFTSKGLLSAVIQNHFHGQAETTIHRTHLTVYGALVDYIKKYGKMFTEQFQVDAKYITKTLTHLITNWKIWNVLHRVNISRYIAFGKRRQNEKSYERVLWQKPAMPLRLGTVQKRAGLGIRLSAFLRGRKLNIKTTLARIADSLLSQELLIPRRLSFAQMPVRQTQDIKAELTTNNGNVRIAETYSPSINIAQSNAVGVYVRNVCGLENKSPVYNLTIQGAHEYFANGVLVHNCDTTRYIVAEIDIREQLRINTSATVTNYINNSQAQSDSRPRF